MDFVSFFIKIKQKTQLKSALQMLARHFLLISRVLFRYAAI